MAHLTHCPSCDDDKTPSPPASIRLHCPSPVSTPNRQRGQSSYSLPELGSKQTQGPQVSASPPNQASSHNSFALTRKLPKSPSYPELPVRSNSNFDTIITRVIEFLRARVYYDLVIPDITAQTATQVVQYFNCVKRVPKTYHDLPPKLLERFRYTYDSGNSTLAIRGMPTKSHDTLAEFFSSIDFTIQLLQNSGAFTTTERLCIKPWLSNVALPGSSKRACDGSNKLGRREKLGDYALVYIPNGENEKQPVFPHVIMEVGFSQEYDKKKRGVLADVREWLVATKGGVKLAVLFKIEEGEVPGKTIAQLEGIAGFCDNNKHNDDYDAYGEGDKEEGEEADKEAESDSCSEPEDYYRRMDDMGHDADNWIGRFTVFMETWVYEATTGGISMKQPRQYLMINNVPTTPMPTLIFTRSTFNLLHQPNKDNNEQFCIDLTQYVKNLLHSRVQDAFRRKTQWISRRKMSRRHVDGDDARDCDFLETLAGNTRARVPHLAGDRREKDKLDGDTAVGEGSENARVVKRPKKDSL